MLRIYGYGGIDGNKRGCSSRPADQTTEKEDDAVIIKESRGAQEEKQTVGEPLFKSVADILRNQSPKVAVNMAVPLISTSPQVEGGNVTVTIDEGEYKKGLEENRHNVIGRLSLPKGEQLLTTLDLKMKLELVWGFTNFRVIPIGRGY